MRELNLDLHDPASFTKACDESVRHGSNGKPVAVHVDGLYCPPCGERRRVDFVWILHPHPHGEMPRLASMRCRQCHVESHGLYYAGPNGNDLVIVRSVAGGTSTPNTPESVKFYLDQAARSEGSSARSAAVAMYRAALEQLLHEQGFATGMLGGKITALEAKVAAGTAPKWAAELDTEFLRVIKDLGNGAIHTNGGDVMQQAALDDALIVEVRATFEVLLDLVNEVPAKKAASLAKLKAAASVVK